MWIAYIIYLPFIDAFHWVFASWNRRWSTQTLLFSAPSTLPNLEFAWFDNHTPQSAGWLSFSNRVLYSTLHILKELPHAFGKKSRIKHKHKRVIFSFPLISMPLARGTARRRVWEEAFGCKAIGHLPSHQNRECERRIQGTKAQLLRSSTQNLQRRRKRSE